MSRPSDGMTLEELREEYDWLYEFQSYIAERISGNPDVHNHADYVNRLEAENDKLREQIELLITLLRNDCDIEASWDGLRKFWNIGLTESGCLMRDRACKAEAENAKLREELDFCLKHVPNCDECEAMTDCWECLRADSSQKERKRLDYENGQLRELVRIMHSELVSCEDNGYVCGGHKFDERVRELGVEV